MFLVNEYRIQDLITPNFRRLPAPASDELTARSQRRIDALDRLRKQLTQKWDDSSIDDSSVAEKQKVRNRPPRVEAGGLQKRTKHLAGLARQVPGPPLQSPQFARLSMTLPASVFGRPETD